MKFHRHSNKIERQFWEICYIFLRSNTRGKTRCVLGAVRAAHLRVRLGKVLNLNPSLFTFFQLGLLSVEQDSKHPVSNPFHFSSSDTGLTLYLRRVPDYTLYKKQTMKMWHTCFSQPWTAVCNHRRASDSSPWKASERCRWDRGWSCGAETRWSII